MGYSHELGKVFDANGRTVGTLCLVIRKDDPSVGKEGDDYSLVDDGDFAAATVNEKGFLRVDVPKAGIPILEALTVQERLDETNSLLRRLVLAMEILHGMKIEDPV